MIPKQLKIGGFKWRVRLDGNVTREGECFGSTHYKAQTIFMDPNDSHQKQEECLVHEVLHVLMWQTGLNKAIDDRKLEEHIVASLAFGLYQVLLDNHNWIGGGKSCPKKIRKS